ncbi:Ribosomal protein S4E [Thermoplasmatales archaeon BRNA1]|nr:Ribosomal protein S4E [Thermoplasmatales archaeon BRNA1]
MSDHIKRIAMPKTWPIPKKAHVYATKQRAGAHSVASSMPASMILRDMLKVCDTAREAKKIIANRDLFVNGKAVKDAKTPVGIMDVVSLPKMEKNFRVVLTPKGKITLVEIPEANSKWIMARVEGKTIVSGGKTQLNLSGGRNILSEEKLAVGDSVKLQLDNNEIIGKYPLGKGAYVLVISGSHSGKVETVEDIEIVNGPASNVVVFQSGTRTVKENVFVIGTGSSEIVLPEGSQ